VIHGSLYVCVVKGLAFTLKERQILGIHGLLPPVVSTPEEQKVRVMVNARRLKGDLDKYIYLAALLDRNEKLFYQVDSPPPYIQAQTVVDCCEIRYTSQQWADISPGAACQICLCSSQAFSQPVFLSRLSHR